MICAIVPAAGAGRRMGADIPKQFLQIAGKTMLAYTLERLASSEYVSRIVVSMALDTHQWHYPGIVLGKPIAYVSGGAQRMDSVLNALDSLATDPARTEWVLVHDAARPNLKLKDINHLVETCMQDPVGGLLALRVRDTMKLSDAGGRVIETTDRQAMWHALTPQMFRMSALRQALQQARRQGLTVTDDASAMELTGEKPLLVEGDASNFKVTNQEDFELMTWLITKAGNAAIGARKAKES